MKAPIVLASAIAVVLLSGSPLSAQQRAITRGLSSNVINSSRGMPPNATVNAGGACPRTPLIRAFRYPGLPAPDVWTSVR